MRPLAAFAFATMAVLASGSVVADEQPAAEASWWSGVAGFLRDAELDVGSSGAAETTDPALVDDRPAIESGPTYSGFADVEVGGLSFGGRYTLWGEDDEAGPVDGEFAFGVGAAYSDESWTVGIDWTRGNFDEVFLSVDDGSGDVIAFTTSYALDPGVRINGLLEYTDEARPGTADAGSFAFGIGTLINF